MNFELKAPAGLEAGVKAVQKILSRARVYQCCGLKLPHYIMNLDPGNGQTTFTEYAAQSFYDAGVRHFGGREHYLEFVLDGSMEQLKNIFGLIAGSAVYTNEYEGVIAMDISALASHINEAQTEIFIRQIGKLAEHATFLFYVPSLWNRNTMSLVNKIRAAVGEVEILDVKPYTGEEIVRIIREMTEDAGVLLEESKETGEILLEAVKVCEIHTIKEAKTLSRTMVKAADFEGFTPKLTSEKLRGICKNADAVKREGKQYDR